MASVSSSKPTVFVDNLLCSVSRAGLGETKITDAQMFHFNEEKKKMLHFRMNFYFEI